MLAQAVKNESNERLWIQSAKEGDEASFAALVAHHELRIDALIRSRLRSHALPEAEGDDVRQEALLKAFRSLETFQWRGPDAFLRWLGTIVEHLVIDLVRRRARSPTFPAEEDLVGDVPSPSKIARRDERFDRLEEALESLSPEHRQVIVWTRLEGRKIAEVAELMGRTPNAVTQLLWRALQNLRERFGGTDSFHLPDKSLGERADDEGRRG